MSCKKYGDGSIYGTVYETGSNKPVPNTEVSILRVSQTYNLHGTVQHAKNEIISRTLSDNNGNYKINFHKKIGPKYYIRCSRGSSHTGSLNENINHKNYNQDLYIKPYRYFKVRVVKTSINKSKSIDITLPLNQFTSINALNNIDTTLPTIFKAIDSDDNVIYYYIFSTSTYPPSSFFFRENKFTNK
jgi:hypothetical protein